VNEQLWLAVVPPDYALPKPSLLSKILKPATAGGGIRSSGTEVSGRSAVDHEIVTDQF
jgi:hypothetical protein